MCSFSCVPTGTGKILGTCSKSIIPNTTSKTCETMQLDSNNPIKKNKYISIFFSSILSKLYDCCWSALHLHFKETKVLAMFECL